MYAKKATTVEFAAGYKPWPDHVDLEGRCGGSNLRFQCIYCGNSYTGAKTRLVQHLAGTKKGIGGYASAPQTAKDWAECYIARTIYGAEWQEVDQSVVN